MSCDALPKIILSDPRVTHYLMLDFTYEGLIHACHVQLISIAYIFSVAVLMAASASATLSSIAALMSKSCLESVP